jgi:hypothetical protein
VYTNLPGWKIGGANRVAVAGNYAYVANCSDGLRIYDISIPARPINVGYATHQFVSAEDIAVAGNYAYLADAANGFWIYSLVPQLDLRMTTTNTAALSWFTLTSPDNYVLQQSANLSPVRWEMLTNTPSIIGGKKQVVVESPSGSAFYRLKLP